MSQRNSSYSTGSGGRWSAHRQQYRPSNNRFGKFGDENNHYNRPLNGSNYFNDYNNDYNNNNNNNDYNNYYHNRNNNYNNNYSRSKQFERVGGNGHDYYNTRNKNRVYRNDSQFGRLQSSQSSKYKRYSSVSTEPKTTQQTNNKMNPALEALINCDCISLVQSIEKDVNNSILFDVVYENLHISRIERNRLKKIPKQFKDKQIDEQDIYNNNKSNYEFKYHPLFYKERICGVSGLPLAVSMSMKEIDLKLLSKFDYYVTEKSDGLRMLFICDNKTKCCYFMDRKMTFYKINHPFYNQNLLSDNGATILDGELILLQPESTTTTVSTEYKTDQVEENKVESDSLTSCGSKIIYYNIFDCISHCGDYFVQETTDIRFQQIDLFVDYFNQQYKLFCNKNDDQTTRIKNSNKEVQGFNKENIEYSNYLQPTLPVQFGAKLQLESNKVETILNCIKFDDNKKEYIFTNPLNNSKSLNDGLIFTPKYSGYLMRKDHWSKWSASMHSDAPFRQNKIKDKIFQKWIDKYNFATYKASKDILKWKPMELRTVDFMIQTPLKDETLNLLNSLVDNNDTNNNNNNNNNSSKDNEIKENVEIYLYCEGKRQRNDGKTDNIINIDGKDLTRYGKSILNNRKCIEKFLKFYKECMEMGKLYEKDRKDGKKI